jgi:hypothetical protein
MTPNWAPSAGSTRSNTALRATRELGAIREGTERLRAIEVDRDIPGTERGQLELLAAVPHQASVGRHHVLFHRVVEALRSRPASSRSAALPLNT